MHIVTVAEMRELEAQADKQYGLSSPILMQNAGKSAADIFIEHLPSQQDIHNLNILLLIGPGNNGGDGLVMAEHLKNAGASINLYHWKQRRLIIRGEEIESEHVAREFEAALQRADYIIDALLGTGTSRPLTEDMRHLLQRVEQERKRRKSVRVVAIDLPTGLNADTGKVDEGCIRADMTITLACPKQGFFFFPGRDYIGELYVGSIGLPEALEQDLHTEMLTTTLVHRILPERPLNSNKGTFGKVMLFCGSPPYPGSAYLAGRAAARVGAGLITLAVSEQMLPIYASSFHEATFAILPERATTAGPTENETTVKVRSLIAHMQGYRALLIGPGLGQSAQTREMILQLLEYLRSQPREQRPRLIIDADGLNNLSALEHWWTYLPEDTVITPHPGEMGRLCNGHKVSGGDIERLELAREKAREWKVTLVLKGACTIIATPDGKTRMNWYANPALASAGTGDVLGGMIAGFLAQGLAPFDAASAGVYLHVAAAQLVSQETGPAGLLASDLLPQIPRAMLLTTKEEL
ncbi:NAD(P)H-hydrate epimerase [Thermosporothrix hazakensis]|jgi:NAD(P)H-hydrate epimerase|uniref:Bifunctional NAD(P)H-hydrate repair enzyme n=1 Tax=Thermosporothrix hazakensis TaxID=644383 RepID=A0A326U083_THEHA|nr:NAD(P)H-hydrate dehydratase [Thermosporothrix hazakensis]PZW22597.1 NAD(P)H-hydrate epimerase [Thermosporothrix hazakensis]GCE48569.1 bifunctional ADP-dependent (S)-NAD(P)H-hydrate dehydratase/NAD(P)H-hydrate epimerase [Thermosporothrix hazakensis]